MEKLETKLNKVLDCVKHLPLDADDKSQLEWSLFFYRVGHIDELQALWRMIKIMKHHYMSNKAIDKLLED